MQELYFAYPGDIDTPTGGYAYDRRVIAGLQDLGWQVKLLPLGEGFPFPSAEVLADAGQKLADLPEGARVIVDGLALGVMPEAASALAQRLRLIALVHHPLCRENGLSAEQADRLKQSENEVLKHAGQVIVTSPATAQQVQDLFGVEADRIAVILPGTDIPELVVRASTEEVHLLSVGTVVPRKGYDLLFMALGDLLHHKWQLDLVGGLQADPECLAALQEQAVRLGLEKRITFHGAVPAQDLTAYYRAADIFVLASRYEGYGMAFTEAIAYGLPVIGSGGGAVKTTLPERASIYCETENVAALRDALDLLITDPERRAILSDAARKAARDLPSWADASSQFDRFLRKVAA